MLIRHATLNDLPAIAAVEAACFPAAEAASADALRERLMVYSDCFWLMIDDAADDAKATAARAATVDGRLVAFINGFVTDSPDLSDVMYADAAQHDPHGACQMVFGVDTAPEYRHCGYASALMRRVIEDARQAGRAGLVLTCKDRLVGFYARLGYVDEGISESTHGNVVWHQMRLRF